MTEQAQPFISLVGILLQLGGALLLAWLFLLLRRYARRRRYFQLWGAAWAMLAVAIAALAVRALAVPGFPAGTAGVEAAVLHYVYQASKLIYIALLVGGTMMYARGVSIAPLLPMAVGGAAAYALVSVHFGVTLRGISLWQAPIAAVALGWCGLRLLLLPVSRRGVGTRVAALAFATMAIMSVAYFISFSQLLDGGAATGAAAMIARLNPYVDVMLHMILGCGMIVMLMEEAKREVDDAHAELAVAHNELRRAALYDSVTGTLNRRAFVEGVGLELARGQFGAVMMLDLDDLKSVNDAYGHSAGDALLRHLADALRSALRPSDKLYRWGGDEFLVVLPGADAAGAHSRLRGIMSQAATLRLGPGEHEVRLGVSMGSADYASAEHMMAAIDRADVLMYEDKSRKKLVRGSGIPAA